MAARRADMFNPCWSSAATAASLIMQRYAHNLFERWQAARFTLILLKNALRLQRRSDRGPQVERVAFTFSISIWKRQP